MENKYYTPNIEDIFIGYECELFLPKNDWFKAEEWRPFKISENGYSKSGPYGGDLSELDEVCSLIKLGQVKTKYLSKEDIESEGYERQNNWFDDTKTQRLGMIPDYKKETDFGSIRLYLKDFNFPHQHVSIEIYVKAKEVDIFNMSMKHFVYHGPIKSINEFRKLCKILEI